MFGRQCTPAIATRVAILARPPATVAAPPSANAAAVARLLSGRGFGGDTNHTQVGRATKNRDRH